jgi:predicted dehydrogenase
VETSTKGYYQTDFALVGCPGFYGVWERSYYLCGFARMLEALLLEPEFVHTVLRRITDLCKAALGHYLDLVGPYLQIIKLGDDLGGQHGPLMSPQTYRDVIKPYHQELFNFIKARTGARLFLHTCGSVYRLLPELIDAGVEVLNPVQVSAKDMDTRRLKAEFGDRLSFMGAIDTQRVLPFGTETQVQQEVERRIAHLGPGVGTALIGCGKVGHTHAQALDTLAESNFVAVCSRNPVKLNTFAAQYDVKAYTDVEAMLQDPEVQMVSICTPQHSHPQLAMTCAQARVHILIEKPMAVDLAGCDQAISAADEAGIKLGVVSQRRFYESVQRVKQAIEAGKIGRPILGTVTVLGWRDEAYYRLDPWRGKWATEGGGVLLTQTTHQLDFFQWLMGPIEELFGYWANLNHPYIEVEDMAVAVVRFKSGALGTILVSNSQKPGFYGKIHVHGENGASVGVQTDGGSPFISGVTAAVDPPLNDVWTVPGEEHLLADWQAEDRTRGQTLDVMTDYHQLQIQDFLQTIIEDRELVATGREGRKPVEIFTAIYRSQRDRRPVKYPLDPVEGAEHFDGRVPPGTS